jgi:hypothetical protein
VYASDGYTTLKCRSTPIECIRRGRPQDGSPLFEEEELRYPGFVEFDDVNGKVLTYSHIKGCVHPPCLPPQLLLGSPLTSVATGAVCGLASHLPPSTCGTQCAPIVCGSVPER